MYAALRLCDLPSLGIFINQKQGYCILDAATLFSEKTVIGEQRYSADNVYRLSHIAMFVKSFPLKDRVKFFWEKSSAGIEWPEFGASF